MSSSLEELKKAEKEIDAAISAMPLLAAPVRVPLYVMFSALHTLFHGNPAVGSAARFEAGHSLAARLATLIPVLARCPTTPEGENARDVVEAYAEIDPSGEQAKNLLSYAHFSQIMPEVHRGYYDVSGNAVEGFKLQFRSLDCELAEMEDFLLSELAVPFLRAPAPKVRAFEDLARTAPMLDGLTATATQRLFIAHYRDSIVDPALVSDTALIKAASVTHAEFNRFRAVLCGLAEFATQLTLALARRLTSEPNSDEIFNEMLEWMILNWNADFVFGFIQQESGLREDQITRLLQLFSLDYRQGPPDWSHAGDGFFPPLVRLTNSLVISPDMVRLFLQTRNVLYGLQRTDPKLFDDFISEELEPELLRAAARLLARISELDVRTNVGWEHGEIDLLVFDRSENAAAIVQAKAPLPPHGARMVDRLEGRLSEAVRQVRTFRALAREQADAVVSAAIGQTVRNVNLTDIILARSCFGTQKVRENAADVDLVSLSLLSLAVERCINAGRRTLSAIVDDCRSMRQELIGRTNAHTEWDTLEINGVKIEIPLLKFDPTALAKLRAGSEFLSP